MTGRQLQFFPDPLDEQFVAFHHANPHVYDELVELAREWKRAGNDRGSINMFFEVLRHRDGLSTTSDDGLKLNNSLRSRYARLIAANERDLAEFFELRALASERGAA